MSIFVCRCTFRSVTMLVKTRDHCVSFSTTLLLIYLIEHLSLNLELMDSAMLADQ